MYVESANIYVLIDPRDNEIRYVGKTFGEIEKRLKGHIYDARCRPGTGWRARWVNKLVRMGLPPRIELVQAVPRTTWKEAESYWIGYYRSLGCLLTNGSPGGDGGIGSRRGVVLTDETKAKISQSNTGKKRTSDDRAKMSGPRPHTRKRLTLICETCGSSFDRSAAHASAPTRKYCSTECRGIALSQELQGNTRTKGYRRSHCRRGHPFTPDNELWYDGQRKCKTCVYDNRRKRRL